MKYKTLLFIINSFIFSTCLSQETGLKIEAIHNKNRLQAESITSKLNTKKETNYKSLIRELNNQGYLNFEIKKVDTISIQKKYIIKFNKRQEKIKIHIDSQDIKYIPKENLPIINQEIEIDFKDIEITLQNISKKVKSDGNIFFEVKLKDIVVKNSTYTSRLKITLQENKKREINKIIVKGYEKFPEKFINSFLKIKRKQTLDLDKIKKSTLKLNTLEFAKQIKLPELLFKKDSTVLYIYIEKKRRNSFDGVIGFNTNETTGKLDFTGYLNLNLLNNFNTGENISLSYRSDENMQRLINLKLDNPYIFKSTLNSNTELKLFTKDSTFTTTYLSEELSKQIGNNSKIGLGVENTTSKVTTKNPQDNSLVNYKTNGFFITYEFKNLKRQASINKNFFNIQLKNSFANRKTEEEKTKQINIEFSGEKLITLNKKNYFFLKTINKKLFTSNLIKNELYRFGGTNTIRGFDENSIEADSFYTINIEYIHILNNSLSINTLTDFAYFENLNLTQKEKLLSIGLGIAAKTKSGILNLIFATGKTGKERLKFSNTKIHLSLKAYF